MQKKLAPKGYPLKIMRVILAQGAMLIFSVLFHLLDGNQPKLQPEGEVRVVGVYKETRIKHLLHLWDLGDCLLLSLSFSLLPITLQQQEHTLTTMGFAAPFIAGLLVAGGCYHIAQTQLQTDTLHATYTLKRIKRTLAESVPTDTPPVSHTANTHIHIHLYNIV
jgi:hypothetical protein